MDIQEVTDMGKIYKFTMFFDSNMDDYKMVVTDEEHNATSPEGYPNWVDTFCGRSYLSVEQLAAQGYIVQIA